MDYQCAVVHTSAGKFRVLIITQYLKVYNPAIRQSLGTSDALQCNCMKERERWNVQVKNVVFWIISKCNMISIGGYDTSLINIGGKLSVTERQTQSVNEGLCFFK